MFLVTETPRERDAGSGPNLRCARLRGRATFSLGARQLARETARGPADAVALPLRDDALEALSTDHVEERLAVLERRYELHPRSLDVELLEERPPLEVR